MLLINVSHYYYPNKFYIIPLAIKDMRTWDFFCLQACIPPVTIFKVHVRCKSLEYRQGQGPVASEDLPWSPTPPAPTLSLTLVYWPEAQV